MLRRRLDNFHIQIQPGCARISIRMEIQRQAPTAASDRIDIDIVPACPIQKGVAVLPRSVQNSQNIVRTISFYRTLHLQYITFRCRQGQIAISIAAIFFFHSAIVIYLERGYTVWNRHLLDSPPWHIDIEAVFFRINFRECRPGIHIGARHLERGNFSFYRNILNAVSIYRPYEISLFRHRPQRNGIPIHGFSLIRYDCPLIVLFLNGNLKQLCRVDNRHLQIDP